MPVATTTRRRIDPTAAETVRLRALREATEARNREAVAQLDPDQAEHRRLADLDRSEQLARNNSLNVAGPWHWLVASHDALHDRVALLELTVARLSALLDAPALTLAA